MALTLTPLADNLGIEATGIDLSAPINDDDLNALRDGVHENLVLVVRDQNLTPAQYLDAMSLFGDLMDRGSGVCIAIGAMDPSAGSAASVVDGVVRSTGSAFTITKTVANASRSPRCVPIGEV